jgi:hypothetical protein
MLRCAGARTQTLSSILLNINRINFAHIITNINHALTKHQCYFFLYL